MPPLSIQVSETVRSRLEARAAESGFDSVEAYVEAVLLADAAPGPVLDDNQQEALLLRRAEGPFVDADEADFRALREKLNDQLGGGSKGAGSQP